MVSWHVDSLRLPVILIATTHDEILFNVALSTATLVLHDVRTAHGLTDAEVVVDHLVLLPCSLAAWRCDVCHRLALEYENGRLLFFVPTARVDDIGAEGR